MIKVKIMIHNANSCYRCRSLTEKLNQDTLTSEELEELKANKRKEWDGNDKGRNVVDAKGYVLSPLIICPHYRDSRAITFEKNPDGKYKRV